MNDLENTLTDAASKLRDPASGVAEDLQTRAKEAWDSAQQQTSRAVREGSVYLRENPVPTALAAFGCGLILGLLLNGRKPVSFQDRYLAEPLHQSRSLLLGLVLAGATLLRRAFSTASSTAGELAGNVGDEFQASLKPLRRAAREAGRNLGL